ncbi:PKD domain-containing protein [Lentzea aerocolonigenes]|uniref:PKD domain-containing protein n=1 Tax=Lentzea aerocolonigenes TaxID=68170 RepID=UPI0009DEAB8A|nr:PKD domain-containing protein [Lentzea aerocolonigenes]MCP2250348.1 PKD domain-containing protein [Lentzea aerocolonigenes]
MPSARSLAVVTAALMGVLVPGVAHAAPPSNDDFSTSTQVTTLPFSDTQDIGGATRAADDPTWCQTSVERSVWYSYTPTADVLVRATTAGSSQSMITSASTGLRGELRGVDDACSIGATSPITFPAKAGTTYHFLVGGYGGTLKFALDQLAPAANDNFAQAQPVTLPFTAQPDVTVASFEADEPESTCVYDEQRPSVWYSYTAPAEALSVVPRVQGNTSAVTVYAGSDITGLREVTCADGNTSQRAIFRATPGTTYYLRFTAAHRNVQPISVSLTEAPPLRPYIGIGGNGNTVYSDVAFNADSAPDDGELAAEWDFGDGTTLPAQQGSVSHRYQADGTYRVTTRATSADGRTGTATGEVKIETHDVGITKFVVPTSARAGQSKPITVHVANTRYLEKTTVTLYRSNGSSWNEVGQLTLDVPAHPTRKVQFPFSYTFTPEDLAMGKVAFRAVASPSYPVRDARPLDNEVISIATTVRPAAVTDSAMN